jgi:alkanesulfonate monooxygenase SsuD/methylene tetrahydromethanopterin reductase-like flavin-dependent oxidoreductase (luciferase family)
MFGKQPFKLGLFGYLHDGGQYLTKHPDRWKADWKDIMAMAKIADQGGLDFLVPISSWKGWTAEINHRKKSFETLTQAAALAAVTERIGFFSTLHVPFVHPVFAAKALTTIDHISGGRAGLNIVCGWNPADNAMFGVPMRVHEDRYAHGFEWWDIMTRILSSGDKEFDYDGKYFPGLKNISGEPLSIQQPQPAIISATVSPEGRRYAARTSDFILGGSSTDSAAMFAEIREIEREVGRTKDPLELIYVSSILCRETTSEAEEAVEEYASHVDNIAVDQWVSTRAKYAVSAISDPALMRRTVAGLGGINGSPQDVAEQIIDIHRQGYGGLAITLFHFLNDLPIVIDRVVPILEKAGIRLPASAFTGGGAAELRQELAA